MGFRLRKGGAEETLLGLVPKKWEVFIERTRSGEVSFAP